MTPTELVVALVAGFEVLRTNPDGCGAMATIGSSLLVLATALVARYALLERATRRVIDALPPLAEADRSIVVTALRRASQGRPELAPTRLRQSTASLPSLAVVGLWRAVIVVHPSLVGSLSDTELGAALAHELSHVRHRDALVAGLLGGLATLCMAVALASGIAYLVFYAHAFRLTGLQAFAFASLALPASLALGMGVSRMYGRNAERRCDRAALLAGFDGATVAGALLKVARFGGVGRRAGLSTMASRDYPLELGARVRLLLEPGSRTSWFRRSLLLAGAALLLSGVLGAASFHRDPSADAQTLADCEPCRLVAHELSKSAARD